MQFSPLLRKWQINTITESHNQLNCRDVKPSFNLHICNTTPALKVRETLWKKGQKDCKNQKIREFAVRFCPLIMSQAILIKSLQHHCLNISWTRMTLMDMSTWTGTSLQDGKPTQRIIGSKECWDRRGVLPQARTQNWLSRSKY